MGSTIENIRICHVNCQSLTHHLDEFRLYFSSNYYHVICISETWLLPSISDDFVALPGYRLVRCDRTGEKRGGGVALYVSSTLKVKVLATSGGEYCGKPEFIIERSPPNLTNCCSLQSIGPQKPVFSRSSKIPCSTSSLATQILLSSATLMQTYARQHTTADTSGSSSILPTSTLSPTIPLFIWRTHPHGWIFVRWTTWINLSASGRETPPSCRLTT